MKLSNLLYLTVIGASLAITVLSERLLIPILSGKASQPIYAEGPSWHKKKSGTPTMGGIGFLLGISVPLLFVILTFLYTKDNETALSIGAILGFGIINSGIGIIDDLSKIAKKENQGLTAGQKLLLQTLSVVAFLLIERRLTGGNTEISFGSFGIELGGFYYVLCAVALLGAVNCANLTDGIDGLATGVAFAIGIALLYISDLIFRDLGYVAAALIGGTLGFLFFNIHPAKIFMGDTGSLFLGAVIGACAIMLGNPLLLIPLGIVYFIEGASVIIQVAVFKLTGKRVFKMAPLHHHLEKCGFSENKIVISALLLTLLSGTLAFSLYL